MPDTLPGTRLHAAETLDLLRTLPRILEALFDGSEYQQIRLDACRGLLEMQDIFDDNDVHLPRLQSRRVLELADIFLLQYNYLLRTSLDNEQLLYGSFSSTIGLGIFVTWRSTKILVGLRPQNSRISWAT